MWKEKCFQSKDPFKKVCVVKEGGKEYEACIFQISYAEKLELYDTLDENANYFEDISQKKFPENALQIIRQQRDEVLIFKTLKYQETLEDHIQKKISSQEQALSIFQDVLKAITDLTIAEFLHYNLRPQHFVRVDGKWKLRTIIFQDDISSAEGLQSEYLWNPKYRSPEQYESFGYEIPEEEEKKRVTWALGSILLDMLMGCHILHSEKILSKFKGKEFSFEKLNLNCEISPKLKGILCKMLHHNPLQRLSPKQIMLNDFFSKKVPPAFRQFLKSQGIKDNEDLPPIPQNHRLNKSSRHSSISSSIKSQSIRGSTRQIRNTSSTLKNIEEIEKEVSKEAEKRERELDLSIKGQREKIQLGSMIHMDTFDDFALDLNEKSKIIVSKNKVLNPNGQSTFLKSQKRIQEADLSTGITQQRQPQLSANRDSLSQFWQSEPRLRKVYQLYKSYLDKSEMLCQSYEKIERIPFDAQEREEILLLAKLSLYYYALIDLFKLTDSMNRQKNIFKIDLELFEQFTTQHQSHFEAFKQSINTEVRKKERILSNTYQELERRVIPKQSQKLLFLNSQDMLNYVENVDFRMNTFADIKRQYRRVMKFCYDKITKIYNRQREEETGRISMYTVYCMTADKLYEVTDTSGRPVENQGSSLLGQNNENFAEFFSWRKQRLLSEGQKSDSAKDCGYIELAELIDYFEKEDVKRLILHSQRVLKSHYNI